ncbi:MAG: PD-(D/E)XK nuclease family protein [Methanobrevibacter sp.]|nr:PD-(D/E)XK nuclease family protein [Methanobrevibacter sp.]
MAQKAKKFSYSKLNTYDSCHWKYYLTYEQGHFISADSLATELGQLIHWTEETIARNLQMGFKPDYENLKDRFKNICIDKGSSRDQRSSLHGINILKDKYKDDFFLPDDNGSSYYTRCLDYLSYGIYRLENYLQANPELEIYGMEKFFSVNFEGNVLSGYIDRIFRDKEQNIFYIEDIKTKNKPFKDTELITPLQFVVYVYALAESLDLDYDHFHCAYDLPFLDLKQEAGTKGFITRGVKKIKSIFGGIDSGEWEPSPSPLCAWCAFSPTSTNQPPEAQLLCPYYSLWTRELKTQAVANKWEGMEKHEEIMAAEAAKQERQEIIKSYDFDF